MPRAYSRCVRFSRKAASRASARMLPSNITPWSHTISRLMILWKWCCSGVTSREISSSREYGIWQTCEPYSATASQVWVSVLMPSSPSNSPAIWKPVTWSRPSSAETRVLKKPVRTTNSDSNFVPA